MEIKISKNADDIYLLDLSGPLDLYSSNQLKNLVLKMFEKRIDCIIVDLKDVTSIISAGIGAMIYIASTLKKLNCPLVFIVPEGPVMQALEVTRIRNFFIIASTLKEAMALTAKNTDGA